MLGGMVAKIRKRPRVTFGARLRELRTRKELTIRELAVLAGCNERQIRRLELGDVDLDAASHGLIASIARALLVSHEELIADTEN